MLPSIETRIADTIAARTNQVAAAIALLDEGATVPFIARYRKEVTAGLDDSQLRTLEERLSYLRDLETRRESVLASIEEQGKLTDALKTRIENVPTKAQLEDLYLPYKPKRRTRAQKAREAGLQPLADALRENPQYLPAEQAKPYIDAEKGIDDARKALDGARAIIMENLTENADLVGLLREWLWEGGRIQSGVIEGKEAEGTKFRDYFEHNEPLATIPSHRLLALLRGRHVGVLSLKMIPPGVDEEGGHQSGERKVAKAAGFTDQNRPGDDWLLTTAKMAWRTKLYVSLSLDLINRAREAAEHDAIKVFGNNLKDLLLTAPAGARTVMGLDPGLRTGVKVAIVDATGKLVDTATIYPHPPHRQWDKSLARLQALCTQHNVSLIAIGNGTASRETDKLAGELIRHLGKKTIQKMVVSEAGASVYSASKLAAQEFPELDVSLRGAVSIARRLQDPLAELVKIEPKAIGVGQYQHDVNQIRLTRTLDACIEDCVNAVGVNVNTASAPLLSRVSGLNQNVAENLVRYRDENGPYRDRKALLSVPRLGPKAFEQCAGFLRIVQGNNPLDASAVHPEAYKVVERIVVQHRCAIDKVIGDHAFIAKLDPADYTDDTFGVPTVKDIFVELEKPGLDPRPDFVAPDFADGVESINDLHSGMVLEGRISNVANFGAFVDVGVHQDGLVHVSALSHQFVKDPRDLVKAGDIVKVKVMDVDQARQRIALSMRLDDQPGEGNARQKQKAASTHKKKSNTSRCTGRGAKPAGAKATGALAQAFAQARKNN